MVSSSPPPPRRYGSKGRGFKTVHVKEASLGSNDKMFKNALAALARENAALRREAAGKGRALARFFYQQQ